MSQTNNSCHIASLVFFRIAFGVVMLIEAIRYLVANWPSENTGLLHLITFLTLDLIGFSRFRENGMNYLFWFLGLLGICIALGAFYRYAVTLFFLSFSYLFLLEKAQYLNHFYLICLLSFILIFLSCQSSLLS